MAPSAFRPAQAPSKLARQPLTEAIEGGTFPRALPCPYCGQPLDWPLVQEIPDPETAALQVQAERTGRKLHRSHVEFTLLATYECVACKGQTTGLGRQRMSDWTYTRDGGGCYIDEFRILWLQPALPLIALPPETPKVIAEATLDAFFLVWHPASCANRLRYAIELIADHFRVPRSRRRRTTNAGPGRKTRRLPLHARVEELAKRRNMGGAKAELLEAAKWLGNDGSHGDISFDEALDAIEIFALALNRIFGVHEPRIERRARSINRRNRTQK